MTAVATTPTTSTWTIDPVHSVAEFKVKHMMVSNVKGQFPALTGKLTLDENDITKSQIEATIDTASITTREPQRDAHLKSADFFDVEKYPTMSFKSTKIVQKGEDELAMTGEASWIAAANTATTGAHLPLARKTPRDSWLEVIVDRAGGPIEVVQELVGLLLRRPPAGRARADDQWTSFQYSRFTSHANQVNTNRNNTTQSPSARRAVCVGSLT